MGIQKIGHQKLRNSRKNSLFNGKDGVAKDIPPLLADNGDDSDDCELADLHCEHGMVQGQICSIPFELYDLPDLREILSLDTWNSCLTEEERFYLSAYLPDMDRQTFCLTMKELFEGNDLFFGNPLDIFFQRLRGGLYPPKLAQLREGLQFLERRKYYYSLKSYHVRMTQMFTDMRGLWDQLELNSGVAERISLWNKRRKQKAIHLLDLNKFPKDDQPLCEDVGLNIKGMKSTESNRVKENFPFLSANGKKSTTPNFRGKGILKIKTPGNGLLPNSNPKVLGSNILEQFRPVPKGVLKVVPKVPSVWLEQSEMVTRGAQPTFPVRTQGLLDLKLSSLPAYLQFPDVASLSELPFLQQNSGRLNLIPNQQPHCFLNQEGSSMRSKHRSESSTGKVEGRMIFPSDDVTGLAQHKLFAGNERKDLNELSIDSKKTARRHAFPVENVWPNLRKGIDHLEGFPFDIHNYSVERNMALMKEKNVIVNPRIPQAVQRSSCSLRDNGKHDMLMLFSSNPVQSESETSAKRPKLSVSERFKDEAVLPLTYKRRKGLGKVNSSDTGKNLIAGADLNCNNQQFIGEGAKAVKMKLTRWKDLPINKES
ncbi:uncharacterized protein LOC126653895 [Mercurialis annua]|uniref:uncharacterized protein LOC126653895 n=1 Tax=Mercurialis annua TaxID=3986 RepID=UPI0021602A54|nr:uncharacterized protein LOC126653895 [Mercurialis annua]